MPDPNAFCLASFGALALVLVVWGFFGERRPWTLASGHVARPWILLGMAALTVAFGTVGWFLHPPSSNAAGAPAHGAGTFVSALYLSVQHLFLNAPAEPGQGTWIQLSRIAALSTILLLAYEAVYRLFSTSLLRVWLARRSDHVIICGLGRTGFQLVRYFRDPELLAKRGESARQVVVIERHADHDRIEAARELGAVVQSGDATDASLLKRLGAARAAALCFVTGSDEANVEGACVATSLRTQDAPEAGSPPCRIVAHLRSADLGTPLEEFVAETAGGAVQVFAFNVRQQAAMEVVARRLLPVRPRTPDKALHAVVYGCGPIAQSVALHVAEYAHFENLLRSRLTIVAGPHEGAAARRLRSDYPRLFPTGGCPDPWHPDPALDHWSYGVRVADRAAPGPGDTGVDFVANGGIVTLEGSAISPESVERLVAIAKRGDSVPCVFLCAENDEANYTMAFELRGELDGRLDRASRQKGEGPQVHIFAYVPHRPSYAKFARREGLITFGSAAETCSFEAITWAPQRRLAELIAATYHRMYGQGDAPPFHTRELWDRRSNLSSAGHVHAKLAVVDRRLARAGTVRSPSAPSPFSEPHRLTVARMEHHRWMAERLLHGWSFGVKDQAARRRPTLVDWDHLSDAEQAKDIAQAIELPNQCTQAEGFELEAWSA